MSRLTNLELSGVPPHERRPEARCRAARPLERIVRSQSDHAERVTPAETPPHTSLPSRRAKGCSGLAAEPRVATGANKRFYGLRECAGRRNAEPARSVDLRPNGS